MRDLIDTDGALGETPGLDRAKMDKMASAASSLGFDIVEIAGFLDLIEQKSSGQRPILDEARASAGRIQDANATVQSAIGVITAATENNLKAVEGSVEMVHTSGARTQSVAEWVQSLDARMREVSSTLNAVHENNTVITSIASQVNILAINAKIEAARAGDAGRGFAVVAEAVNELSRKTSAAAADILDSVRQLSGWIDTLRSEAETVAGEARTVLSDSQHTDKALISIADNVRETHEKACAISEQATAVDVAGREFAACFARIDTAVTETATGIHQAHTQVNALIDQSETLVQQSVALGGGSADAPLIAFVQDRAAVVADLFADAMASGKITREALFDFTYTEIPNTDPQQFMTPFLDLCDRVLPPILEGALSFDPKIVFCAAVTLDGFLPTHNRKFSRPQRAGDPAWNAANSRNRRLFNDRVGLKAGRNREPFLMQIYRRDMGGGEFKMMKDLSSPIVIDGTQWGGFRMGISF